MLSFVTSWHPCSPGFGWRTYDPEYYSESDEGSDDSATASIVAKLEVKTKREIQCKKKRKRKLFDLTNPTDPALLKFDKQVNRPTFSSVTPSAQSRPPSQTMEFPHGLCALRAHLDAPPNMTLSTRFQYDPVKGLCLVCSRELKLPLGESKSETRSRANTWGTHCRGSFHQVVRCVGDACRGW